MTEPAQWQSFSSRVLRQMGVLRKKKDAKVATAQALCKGTSKELSDARCNSTLDSIYLLTEGLCK